MNDKPVVLVTRRLPEAVEARLERDYNARLNVEDDVYSADRIIELSEGAVAVIWRKAEVTSKMYTTANEMKSTKPVFPR